MQSIRLVSRKEHPESTVVKIDQELAIGGPEIVIIAGPCAVEGRELFLEAAQMVKSAGASALRGGAFKPRTSPYSFAGLKREGLEILSLARRLTGLPVVSEVMDVRDLEEMAGAVDILQIGSRNMQNFSLLREAGKINLPVLLKRGFAATIKEWLLAAEYIVDSGNPRVILCERGIRTFETYTRNTVDLGAVVAVKEICHLPVLVDPSHATGRASMVGPVARAALAAGADGLLIEVHQDPSCALSDGFQSITPDDLGRLIRELDLIAGAVGRRLAQPTRINSPQSRKN